MRDLPVPPCATARPVPARRRRAIAVGLGLCAAACAEPGLVLQYADGSMTTDIIAGSSSAASTGGSRETTTDDGDTLGLPCGADGQGCKNLIDLLFVIDNSGTMGEEQLNLARNFPLLIERLQALPGRDGQPAGTDVNIMVTTTDFGNPACTGQSHPDYEPAGGHPIFTPCTERLARFEGLGDPPTSQRHACTEVCDPDAPAFPADPFIHIAGEDNNVIGGTPADALACIGPQGIDGCGFEATLESMAQALDLSTCWNDPSRCTDPAFAGLDKPFLRDGALLAIAIITDEADCSVQQFSVMQSQTFMATNPQTMQPGLSSALCWNAGVVCTDLDETTGEYAGCVAADKGIDGAVGVPPDSHTALQPLARYRQLFAMLHGMGKDIIMLGVLGVPEVTEHAPQSPFEPTAGGVHALAYRQWRDEDIADEEWADGLRPVDKQFEFGVGPGCTARDEDGAITGQAIPPVRIREICESLNVADDPATPRDETSVRCCVESICDEDFSDAISCLTGLIQNAFAPEE